MLYDYFGMLNDEARCEREVALVAGEQAQSPPSPAWRVRWLLLLAHCLDYWNHPHGAQACRDEIRQRVQEGATDRPADAGWRAALQLGLLLSDLQRAPAAEDTARQDRLFERIEALRVHLRPGLLPRGLFGQAVLLMQRGRWDAALSRIDLALAVARDVEVPERDCGVYHELRSYALAGLDRWDDAQAEIVVLQRAQTGAQAEVALAIAASLQAARRLQGAAPGSRDPAIVDPVLSALRAAAALSWKRFLPYFPRLVAACAQIGLQARQDVEFLRAMVRERRLVPPGESVEDWPWLLRVRALGPLRIEHDDRVLADRGKAQRKPLELLAVLAAHGGCSLPTETLIDTLWPSTDADAPRASLDMAVSRLRKLLRSSDSVVVADGCAALHTALVWTDVGALEGLCDGSPLSDPAAALDAVLDLYEQPLLSGERVGVLLLQRRQQLQARLEHLVCRCGAAMEQAGQWTLALSAYRRALGVLPLSEAVLRAAL